MLRNLRKTSTKKLHVRSSQQTCMSLAEESMTTVNVTSKDRERFARARVRGQTRSQDASAVVAAVMMQTAT